MNDPNPPSPACQAELTALRQRVAELEEEKRRRQAAEEALAASERQYRNTIDSMAEGIHVIDRDMRIVLINEPFRQWCRQLGLGELRLGQDVFETFPFLPRKVLDEYREVFRTGKVLISEEPTMVGKTEVITETRKIPIMENGSVTRVVTAVRDITQTRRAEGERSRLEAQVQQTRKLDSLGVLAGGIAHDFNNLLMAILGHTDMVLADLVPESPIRESLLEIELACHRATDLCRQMLAYAGLGRRTLEPIDLTQLVRETSHLLHISISKKARLLSHLEEDIPAVEADPSQIRQVLVNLVVNASEAIGESEGTIALATGVVAGSDISLRESLLSPPPSASSFVYIEVADTGCGMTPETQARIFDPFFTTKFAGRGLGLAAVQGIVRQHGGTIGVRSAPGKGTTFRVLFPASARTAAAPARTPAVEPWQGRGTILVVDDDELARTVAGKMVERCGFQTLVAADGHEAVRLYREHAEEIVCVLLDLTMPQMDGVETHRELRRIRDGVPTLVASGYTEEEILRRFAGEHLAGAIAKPYQMAALSAKLRQVLAGIESPAESRSARPPPSS
jgi:PAS domain S-box-containing protein